MGKTFLPSRDSELDNWLNNFSTLIAAAPATYGLSSGDGTALTTAFANWHAAFLAAVNPTTRTKGNVATKNQQRAIVLALVRGYAATIRINLAVSDALKIGLGLHVRDTVPSPVPAPATYPVLAISGMGRGLQDLRAADQNSLSKRARPMGTTGLLLFRAIGETPATEPAQAAFLGFVTRAAFQATFDAADHGKVATYFARWTNSKGEVGPWGPPASMPIAA